MILVHSCPDMVHQFINEMLIPSLCRSIDQTLQTEPSVGYPPTESDQGEIFVSPSTLPAGLPIPPKQRFPAEFECPLCFHARKFSKPSDWAKHIHEDIQPFVCTFEECSEPRSFKRKADWVRHENERHRQLEWWACSMRDCSHKCYRKDNFIQHLVREHRMPEPKMRSTDIHNKSEARARAHNMLAPRTDIAEEELWRIVETCRQETVKDPKDEPCKFCGTACNSWKKLTVHVAKHLENIAIPIWSRVALTRPAPGVAVVIKNSNSK